jgi:SAM-dependent methyltransferase
VKELRYKFGSVENKPAHYLPVYQRYLPEITVPEPIILELGVHRGDSLEMLADYFPAALVLGVDANEMNLTFSTTRIKTYQGLQDDTKLHAKVMAENNISAFDLIIDDCSHIGSLAAVSFQSLFPKLKPGGLYLIEDWGAGYWPKWPEGALFDANLHFKHENGIFPSHWHGLPGFLKQLMDEVAMPDITSRRGSGRQIPSLLEFMHIYQGIAVLKKAT